MPIQPIRRASFRLMIRRVEPPFSNNLEEELNWICQSLGFFEVIDKEKTAAAVFKEIVTATENGQALTSTAIADQVGMSRGAVINHLNNLLRSGLVVRHGRYYSSRSKSMVRTIEEIEEDIDRIFDKIKNRAKQIDEKQGLSVEE
ncbi:helix-turn-helix domain-containing protein [Candidatus Micrarchaeota archaeon]|nr:helix-turn-helix domain-containing protein [Candidatus Micrarchaeota archaeon]MBU1930088.1 helix-turn-helix domain-containing protein [Candidatus Micrarchaeota archaeon]